MTFDDIVSEVSERLNLTSDVAIARVGRSVNERYRWMSSSMGLQTMRRIPNVSASTVVGNRSLVFGPAPTPVEKIMSVYNPSFTNAPALSEVSFDELRNSVQGTDPPRKYAIQRMGANTVTIYLSSTPETVYELNADVESNQAVLSGVMIPAFTESYHDILIYGAMATEYDKLEKAGLSKKKEDQYEQRLGEYRLFIAKSAYKDIHQGKTGTSNSSVSRVM